MRGNRRGEAGLDLLREALGAANLRALMGVVDVGRVTLAQVRALRGAAVTVHDGRDLLVRVVDVLTELPMMARLHVPANILWRRPRAGESMAVVTPANINGPGGPVALYGDGGAVGAVPPWLADDKSGIYAPETVRVESKEGDVEVHVADGHTVKLGAGATKSVTRQGDTVDCGTLVFTPNVGTAPAVLAWVAPGGTVPPLTGPMVAIPITGRVGPGSAKVKAED